MQLIQSRMVQLIQVGQLNQKGLLELEYVPFQALRGLHHR